MAIEAVLFDYAGVITQGPRDGFAAIARAGGAEPRELIELIFGSYGHVEGEDVPFHQFERGEITLEQLHDWGVEHGAPHGWQLRLIDLPQMIHDLVPREEVLERIADLRRRGIKTALVTNNALEFRDIWRAQFDVEGLFDVVVDSHEVGLRKPEPAIYTLALERLGVAPEHAVMVDDMPVNVEAAQALGLGGVVVGEDVPAALAELEALLAA